MWPFKKKEPKYSEVGNRLYELLQQSELWANEPQWATGTIGRSDINVRLRSLYGQYCYVLDTDLNEMFVELTADDHLRLSPIVNNIYMKITEERNALRTQEHNRQLLSLLAAQTPLKIDETATVLARSVLRGDMVAARALADRVIELSNGE